MLLAHGGDVSRTQSEQIEAFRQQLALMQQHSDAALRRVSEVLAEQLRLLAEGSERRQSEMRQSIEVRLQALQEGNERKLEQMRATVDEKLQGTLEARLGESFRLVSERLEHVQRG
ncbi:MAG TPA: DNA recombination protein RmuC, partial [Burkholderiaceae bacterium]|nr:DNA recombination protein RmuC [Burkholderiaceae bacterium]